MATEAPKLSSTMNFTENEVDSLAQALKHQEFRDMLCDYAKEISDPVNKAQYEADIVQMELDKGFECTFLHPKPGYVLKTTNLRTDEKVFINVCSDDAVGEPECVSECNANQPGGIQWSIPYFQSQPRKDIDRSKRPCTVYDVIFHPKALTFTSPRLKSMVIETAVDAVEKAFNVKLEHDNLRFPKMKFKGTFRPTVIRKPISNVSSYKKQPDFHESSDEDLGVFTRASDDEENLKTPEYVMKYKYDLGDGLPTVAQQDNDPCRPTAIVVDIMLPKLGSTAGVDLDITERSLTLESSDYSLKLNFPYCISEEKATARFDKASRKLTITTPVIAANQMVASKDETQPMEVQRLASTDSGIDEECLEPKVEDTGKNNQVSNFADDFDNDLIFPSYSCNIYEDLMIFTLDVKNVNEDSLVTEPMTDNEFGFVLKFSSIGSGRVTFNYGFFCSLVVVPENIKEETNILDCVDVEVWDNNVLIKVSLPAGLECEQYKVGSKPTDLIPHSLPKLRALRQRREKMMKSNEQKKPVEEGKASKAEEGVNDLTEDKAAHEDGNKARHASDESGIFCSTPPPENNEEASEENSFRALKSILKCTNKKSSSSLASSKSSSAASFTSNDGEEDEACKKSVSFNEVVQRKIYRPDSSILGQNKKNRKKKQAKLRRAERRASESDANDTNNEGSEYDNDDDDEPQDKGAMNQNQKKEENREEDEHADSGLASSVDDYGSGVEQRKAKRNKRKQKGGKKGIKNKANLLSEATNDLIFDMDF